MSEEIVPFDLVRMFMGDEPPLYILEILFRTTIIYIYTLLLLRLIGGRSVSQLSLIEFLLVIALGSAVGDALFYPQVPLLHAMAVITLVVAADKVLDKLTVHFRTAKRVLDGEPTMLVRDGQTVFENLREQNIGDAELRSRLRTKGIRNLGEVEFAFSEPGGVISVFRYDEPRPGLRIAPPAVTVDLPDPDSDQRICCKRCGHVTGTLPADADPAGDNPPECDNCGGCDWTRPETQDRQDA